MKEQLISFETAKLAKEKGFNWECFYYYDNNKELVEPYEENGSSTDVEFRVDLTDLLENHNYKRFAISAPTQSLLQKWLREKFKFHITINIGLYKLTGAGCNTRREYRYFSNIIRMGKHHKNKFRSEMCKTYEEALEKGLYEALKLI